jgi:hypothetical protein
MREGRLDGRDLDHWLKAEQVVKSRLIREEGRGGPEGKKEVGRKQNSRRDNRPGKEKQTLRKINKRQIRG